MITQLEVRNYRNLADVKIDFEPLTVLVGPNGSGKSSVIDTLRFISDALRLGLKSAVTMRAGMAAIRRWSAKGRPFDIEIGVSLVTAGYRGSYHFVLSGARKGEYHIKSEDFKAESLESHHLLAEAGEHLVTEEGSEYLIDEDDSGAYSIQKGRWANPPSRTSPAVPADTLALPLLAGVPPYKDIYAALVGMSFYTIYPRDLREHQPTSNPYPLEEAANNLASVLENLDKITQERLKKAIRYVVPDVDDYAVRQAGSRLVVRLRHLITPGLDIPQEGEKMPWFELAQESDGTLRMLALLTALYQTPARSLIALEEPELTVHPGAMAQLWDEIKDASQRSQILITSHSPDLLDLCSPEQLRVVEKINGVAYVGPIDEIQKAVIRDKLFTPGQLLQAQGLMRQAEPSDVS